MSTWYGDPPPQAPKIGAAGWVRILRRGLPLVILVFGGLAVHGIVRLGERCVSGARRSVTPLITQAVCKGALRLLGLTVRSTGVVSHQPCAFVANHASWLDIFVLNAQTHLYFVSKADVADWPGIGWLANATGTVFIDRQARQAENHRDLLSQRLGAGHRLLFFPEGTSTDGRRVLPFKSTLFAAFFKSKPILPDQFAIQPISVTYHEPLGQDPRFYGWWGDMAFGPHLLKVLAAPAQGHVALHWHTPLMLHDFTDRKKLARTAGDAVRTQVAAEQSQQNVA